MYEFKVNMYFLHRLDKVYHINYQYHFSKKTSVTKTQLQK